MLARICYLTLILALGACMPGTEEPDSKPLSSAETGSQTVSDTTPDSTLADDEKCRAEGGRVEVAGLLGNRICIKPAPDAGNSCNRASDCAGLCLSDTRTCSVELPTLGCFGILDETGKKVLRCVE